MPPREMPQPKPQKPEDLFNLVNKAGLLVSGPLLPPLRSHCGSHAFEHLWPCTFYLLAYAGFANIPALLYYVPVWFALLIFRRVTSDRTQHSRYQGWPWLGGLFTRKEKLARTLEPVLVFAGGIAAGVVWEPLGGFLILGAVGMYVTFAIELMVTQSRKRAMQDAFIEAEHMARIQSGQDVW